MSLTTNDLLGALQSAQESLGVQIVVHSALGDFTIDPGSGQAISGNQNGENGGGAMAMAILKLLDLKVSLRTRAAVFGPVSVTP